MGPHHPPYRPWDPTRPHGRRPYTQATIPPHLGAGQAFFIEVAPPPIASHDPMRVKVLAGMKGGMLIKVDTPSGVVQATVPAGLAEGDTFWVQVTRPAPYRPWDPTRHRP